MRIGNQISSSIAAVGIAAGLVGAAHAEPLRIFYFDWAGYGPFFLAQEKGFYEQEGIAVELVPVADTHAAYAGLLSGHVDAIAAVIQDIPFFWTPDDHLVCVLAISYSNGADGIVARKDIASVADLKGRTVAYEDGSSTHFYLNVVLKEAGLGEADIVPVEVPDSDAVTAFLLGEIDALSTYGGMLVEALQAPHAHLLTDSSEQPHAIVDCLITTPQVLQARRADFQALGRAWDAAVDYVETNSNEAIRIMAARLGGAHGDPEVFAAALGMLGFYDGERNVEYFGTPDQPGQAYGTAQSAIDIWTSVGALNFDLTPADMIGHGVWDE